MDAAKALAFARKNPHAVLATMKRDGTPQLSPVLVGLDSQDRLVVSTRETAMKTLNVRRDPRAWLCVLNDRFFGDWAQLSGDVEVVSLRRWNHWFSTTASSPESIRTGTTTGPP
ncbi:MAG TPA: TIGR03618 family F420-dependent PPOX class oxidoreductase [Propionibacteriaceae bacterium]